MNTKLKKICAFAVSVVLCSSLSVGSLNNIYANTVCGAELSLYDGNMLAEVNKKFDLGANAQSGFTSVSANDKYDKNKGYGFSGNDVKNVTASGINELSDAVQFTGNTTFDVDLPNGLYKIKVTLGDTQRTSIYMENMLQIVNMTGNNAVDEILIPVTDSQLNIRAAAGKAGYAYTISSLEINKVADNAELPSTIWICGDSTVCNYYPLNTSKQAGWGQMLSDYVDNGWNIRNMAASGQYAKGFIDAGQFDAVEKYGKSGDVYIISIGINDTNYSNKEEYYNTVTDMVKRAKAKGMDVILVKQQGRNGDAQRNPLLKGRWFSDQLDRIGNEQNCQVVDLFNMWQDYCISVGADKTTAMYMDGDQLHPNRTGAAKLAELFASEFGNGQNPATTPLGDINNDMIIDTFDMLFLRRMLMSGNLESDAKKRADVNSDGNVNISDAVELQKFLLTGQKFAENAGKSADIVYAADMKIDSGVTENINAGFKGKSYVNLDNKVGSSIEWTVNVVQSGNYLCSFNTANGSTANRVMKIEVNNGTDYWMQDFLSTGEWTNWKETGIVLSLKKGENKILMTSVTEQGGPNFDYLKTELTDEPIAEIYIPQDNNNDDPNDNKDVQTIYIAGDSTVQTYRASYAPQQGWGAFLGENLSDKYSVLNYAIAGRSSKSFYDNGRLDTILNSMKKNDYLLIQFGINDSASGNSERYAPVCGNIPGTNGSFESYMAKYIEGAKDKGATPILVTTVIGLKAYNSKTGQFENSYTNYCSAMKQLASYYNVPIIDLNTLMVNYYNSIGYDSAYKYHMCSTGSADMTHFTETGAKAIAGLVADELKRQGLC